MSERPTPETDALRELIDNGADAEAQMTSFARKLERERDEARDIGEKLSKQGLEMMDENRTLKRERDEALSQIVQAECRAERFCQERDEAREDLDEEMKFHHRTHSELIQTQCNLMDVTQAIIATLEENRNLSDGEDCTLAKLKSAVPEWK